MTEPCPFCKSKHTEVVGVRREVAAAVIEDVRCTACHLTFELHGSEDVMLSEEDARRVDEIEARVNAATGGGDWHHCTGSYGAKYCICGQVWSTSADAPVHTPVYDHDSEGIPLPTKKGQAANSVFIAHAPQDIRDLLALVRRLSPPAAPGDAAESEGLL